MERRRPGRKWTARSTATRTAGAVLLAACLLGPLTAAQPPGPPPADPAAGQPLLLGHRIVFRSTILGEERPLLVRLPPGYERFPTRRYPLLVLLDGEGHFHHASGLAEYLARQGVMPEVIVVGVPNTDRARDMSPVVAPDRPGSGGGIRFADFLADELVPWLDATYRTEPFRILFGHSATGLFALWSLGEEPDLFSAVIAASPWVIWNEGWIVGDTDRRWRDTPPGGRFAFLTVGDEPEVIPTLDRYRRVLRQRAPKRLSWTYERMPGDDHGTLVPGTIDRGLRWIFDGWRLTDPTADLAAVQRHYAAVSERLGYQVSPPETVVNLQGYRHLQAERMELALELFAANVAAWPQSANVHDSLGEGLRAAGRLEEAAARFRRAVELGRASDDPLTPAFEQNLAAAEKALAGDGS